MHAKTSIYATNLFRYQFKLSILYVLNMDDMFKFMINYVTF